MVYWPSFLIYSISYRSRIFMSVLQLAYYHPNLTSEVCSVQHKLRYFRVVWLSVLIYAAILVFSLHALSCEKMTSNTLHSHLLQWWADASLTCTQQARPCRPRECLILQTLQQNDSASWSVVKTDESVPIALYSFLLGYDQQMYHASENFCDAEKCLLSLQLGVYVNNQFAFWSVMWSLGYFFSLLCCEPNPLNNLWNL